ncbi:MAG: polysaccharide biosynthesis protein [Planctomycetota bacterium]|nr:polysaccharide biosynthesis protein [Planctomycetota bacterium]
MSRTAILIGLPPALERLERQLDLLPDRPVTLGWILAPGTAGSAGSDRDAESSAETAPILGRLDELETIVARRRPAMALISLPAAMSGLITRIRTRLRRLHVPERFMPTLEDQLAGVGPRTHLDIDLSALLDRPRRAIDEAAVGGVIAGKRVLITGAGGSIGSELARIVARFGPRKLLLMDRAENALFEIDRQIARFQPSLPRKALLHDVVDSEETLELCRRHQPEIIFHAAAHKHVPMMEDHPALAVDNNLFGTKSIADAADEIRAERFVMISTDKAVNPSSIMGATKRLAELYVQWINQRSATAYSMVRFGNVLGSSGSVLEIWSKQIADGGPVTVTDEAMTRYFMTIEEAATLVIQSAALVDGSATGGEVFLLDMGEPIRIVDLARRFIDRHGLTPRGEGEAPANDGTAFMPIVFTGARPGEKLHEQLAFDAECMEPTRHADINIWRLPSPDEGLIKDILSALSPELRQPDAAVLADQIRRLARSTPRPVAA